MGTKNRPAPTSENVISRSKDYFTHSEVRRAIKHCMIDEMLLETELPGLDKEKMQETAETLAQIAVGTFIAVTVITDDQGHAIGVERIDDFFTKKKYPELLKERRKTPSKKAKKANGWKKQLYTLIFPKPSSSSSSSSLKKSSSLKDFTEEKEIQKPLASPKTS